MTHHSKQSISSEVIETPAPSDTGSISRTDASIYGAKKGFIIERHGARSDVPIPEAKALLFEFASMMHRRVTDAGGPDFDYNRHVEEFVIGLDNFLPPKGTYLLLRDGSGEIIGIGALRRVSDDTAEMKHLYIRPAGRRNGLGEALIRARIDDARTLGIRWLVADTFKVNPELPPLYARLGFQRVPTSGTSKTLSLSPEVTDLMWFYRFDLNA